MEVKMSATATNWTWVNLSYRAWEIDVLVCEEPNDATPRLWHGKRPKKISQRLTKELIEDFGESFFWEKLTEAEWGK
tara:strand:+ start:189 stop:419 length:231 start_codon:yes stop_codon:yes gene_type:complete